VTSVDLDQIQKSSRHSKIIGAFGEAFLSNWLSRSGFDVVIVDHSGLDLVAYYPDTGRRLGITVKSRTRSGGTEAQGVTVFFNRKRPSDRKKLLAACKTFGCELWVAVYVETAKAADLYLLSLQHFDDVYCPNKSSAVDAWKMGERQKRRYEMDPEVRHIEVEFRTHTWTFPPTKVRADQVIE